jgi:hypothetical protein
MDRSGDIGSASALATLCCLLFALYLFIRALRDCERNLTGTRPAKPPHRARQAARNAPREDEPTAGCQAAEGETALLLPFRVFYATSEDSVAEILLATDMKSARDRARRRLRAGLVDPLPLGRSEEIAVLVVPVQARTAAEAPRDNDEPGDIVLVPDAPFERAEITPRLRRAAIYSGYHLAPTADRETYPT